MTAAAGGKRTPVKRRTAGPIEREVARYMRALKADGELEGNGPSLAALALELARTMDTGAGLAVAAVARELRATLVELAPKDPSGDDELDHWLKSLSAPVRDSPSG